MSTECILCFKSFIISHLIWAISEEAAVLIRTRRAGVGRGGGRVVAGEAAFQPFHVLLEP